MSVKTEQVEKNLVKLTFEVTAEAFSDAMNKAYAKNSKKYSVPGFRKGKVPRAIIEKYYTEAVFYDDAINMVLPEAYEAALKESGVEAAARPEIDVEEIKKGEPVVFTALVTTKPEVKLGEYVGIKVNKIEHNVTDEDVEREIENLQAMGVKVETNVVVGRTIEIDELFAMGYEAIFIGSGAGLPNFMNIPGEGLCGVYSANEFLTRINLMKAYLPDSAAPINRPKRAAIVPTAAMI